jgi:hypothetical protein
MSVLQTRAAYYSKRALAEQVLELQKRNRTMSALEHDGPLIVDLATLASFRPEALRIDGDGTIVTVTLANAPLQS